MAEGTIVWTKRASLELQTVLEYYTERNGNSDYSYKILLQIEALLNTIATSQYLGRITSDKRTRVVPFLSYLIFYEINDNQIDVMSFWDNRQSNSKRLKL